MSETTAVVENETEATTEPGDPAANAEANAAAADAHSQGQLFPDEIKEEEEVREVLIPMHPHEVLEAVDRIVALNQEVNEHEQELEREKSRHKEAKDKITANIDAARPKLSKLIELTGLKKRRETTKTIKRINYTTKMVQWFVEGPVDERPMVAAEHQVKLALPEASSSEEASAADSSSENGNPSTEDGDAQGVDPASMDEAPKSAFEEDAETYDKEEGDERWGETAQ